jgi:hypothetical protein
MTWPLTASDLRSALGYQLTDGDATELALYITAACEAIDKRTGRIEDPSRHLLDGAVLGVVTVPIVPGIPSAFTKVAHGLTTGQIVYLTTTGTLPTGLTPATRCFVAVTGPDTFLLCTSRANALTSAGIITAGTQTGVHTLWGVGVLPIIFTLSAREAAKLWWQQSKNGPRGVPGAVTDQLSGPPMGAALPRKVEGWLSDYPPAPGIA